LLCKQLKDKLMKLLSTTNLIAACALIYWPAASFSHIVLENKAAAAGSTYKAVFQVGHGCNGSPTTAIAVQIPPGFQAAKPYAKAGWALAIDPNRLITWTALSKEAALQNAHFDEFVLRGKLPEAAGPLWFKVLQTCESGSNNWADVPATGVSTKGMKLPAALLEVSAPVAAMPAEHKH
jgi:periplasmic copper chaperone A